MFGPVVARGPFQNSVSYKYVKQRTEGFFLDEKVSHKPPKCMSVYMCGHLGTSGQLPAVVLWPCALLVR